MNFFQEVRLSGTKLKDFGLKSLEISFFALTVIPTAEWVAEYTEYDAVEVPPLGFSDLFSTPRLFELLAIHLGFILGT